MLSNLNVANATFHVDAKKEQLVIGNHFSEIEDVCGRYLTDTFGKRVCHSRTRIGIQREIKLLTGK